MVGSHATIFVFLSPSLFSVCSCVQVHAKPVHSPQTRHVHKLHATKLNFIVSNWKVFHIEAVAVSSLPFSIPFPSVSLKYIRYSLRTWKWCWKRCLNMNWTLKSWWCYMSKKRIENKNEYPNLSVENVRWIVRCTSKRYSFSSKKNGRKSKVGHKQRWQMLTDTVLICLAYLFVNKVIDYRGKKKPYCRWCRLAGFIISTAVVKSWHPNIVCRSTNCNPAMFVKSETVIAADNWYFILWVFL